MKKIYRTYSLAILVDFLFLLAIWQGVSLYLSLPVFPSPVQVGGNLVEVFFPLIAIHAEWSLW